MKLIVGFLAVAALAGCSTYAVPRYSISADNVVALKATAVNGVSVGAFTQAPIPNERPDEIMCRAVGPIKTPDGETFADFVKSGLVSELKIAEVYAPAAPVQLTGRLENIGFSSVILSTYKNIYGPKNAGYAPPLPRLIFFKISGPCFLQGYRLRRVDAGYTNIGPGRISQRTHAGHSGCYNGILN
ncbi:hypothetical protein [Paraburkholderia sp. JPY419]|uniref:hypothetical protein n=1 Tax=Paraburkholderia sp. JPY419 TaxID=667660 RepID=UPI003D1E5D1D